MRKRWAQTGFLLAVLATAVMPVSSQTKPSFEVASVKPSAPAGSPLTMGATGGRFTATNVPLRLLIQLAYQSPAAPLLPNQIVGGPNWLASDHFDIEAKPEGPARAIPLAEMWPRVQSLLEDRFKLKVHRETRELPVFNLVVAKGGLKMKQASDSSPLPVNPDAPPLNPTAPPVSAPGQPAQLRGLINVRNAAGNLRIVSGNAVPITTLRNTLQSYAGRPVIDRTNLKGLYDFRFEITQQALANIADPGPNAAPPADALSLFSVIEQQLGLKLESARGPVEVIVIDSVQKPTAN